VTNNEHLIVWRRTEDTLFLAARCAHCNGTGSLLTPSFQRDNCAPCGGRGWFGIAPDWCATVDPGSVEKVAVLGVRYAAGQPLWNRRDRCACEVLPPQEAAVDQARNGSKRSKRKSRKRSARNKSAARNRRPREKQSTALAP